MRDTTKTMKTVPAILPATYPTGAAGSATVESPWIDRAGFGSLSFALAASAGPEVLFTASLEHTDNWQIASVWDDTAAEASSFNLVENDDHATIVDQIGMVGRGALYLPFDASRDDGRGELFLKTGAAPACGIIDYIGGKEGMKRFVRLKVRASAPFGIVATAILRRPLTQAA